ncbi:hypothetical protein LINGRAHAP2_LOCUS30311 [Linum grandiflorum]
MTRDDRLFSKLELCKSGKVSFGDNTKGRILGQGSIGMIGHSGNDLEHEEGSGAALGMV